MTAFAPGKVLQMMKRRAWHLTAILLLLNGLAVAAAATISISPSPILYAVLPAASTYEVECSTNGATWLPTGVLVAGSGKSNGVRLDGWPGNAAYRLSRIGAADIVTPAIVKGWHLKPSFPGASELHIDARTPLNAAAWTNQAFVFPDLQDEFISPLPAPLAGNAFFRAVQPATPLAVGTVTSYPPDLNSLYAGYGLVADDMPQLFRDGYIAALCPAVYHRGGTNAAAAGECYELVGPQGRTTVMVADLANESLPGTCDIGKPYFDIGTAAFTNLFAPPTGIGPATYRLVPAPAVGNVKMVCVVNSAGYYVELRPYNHRAGVSRVELQITNNGPWIELSRTEFNSFVYSPTSPLTLPFNARVTSRFGEVIDFPSTVVLTNGSRLTANGQFNTFPDQGPAPIWIVPPVYAEGFSNSLGAPWIPAPSSELIINPAYSGSVYQGSYSLQLTNFVAFSLIDFVAPVAFPKHTDGFLEFAIRSEGAPVSQLALQITGTDNAGNAAASALVDLPTIDGIWRVLRIPLDPAAVPPQIKAFFLQNTSNKTASPVDLDSISFRW